MKTSICFLTCLLFGCAQEPITFSENGHDDSGDSSSDGGSDIDSDHNDTETVSEEDTDSGSDTGTEGDIDSGPHTDTDTETGTDTGSETSSEVPTETDTGDGADTETGHDTEDDTDTNDDAGPGDCPWSCVELEHTAYACDDYPEDPSVVQNWNFTCEDAGFCCQPLGDLTPGALDDYCLDQGFECIEPTICPVEKRHTEFYCNASWRYCCG